MKHYLLLFRDQAFSASWTLFKRLIPNSFLAVTTITVVSLIIVTPLMLLAMGYGATDFIVYQQNMLDLQNSALQNQGNPELILETYRGLFTQINWTLITLTAIIGLLVYSWSFNFLYVISDNEIRLGQPSFFKALSQSFSKGILRIAAYFVVYFLLFIAVMGIFIFTISLFMRLSTVIGILLAFVGFLFVIVFFIRFIIVIPAIVHGNYNVTQAISYSLTKINWKRGWMLFLLGIISLIVVSLISFILALIFVSKDNLNITARTFIFSQIINLVVNFLLLTYVVAASSTLYFRYSDDVAEEDDLQHHIIEDGI